MKRTIQFGNWGISLNCDGSCRAFLNYPVSYGGPVEPPHIREIAEAWRDGGELLRLLAGSKYLTNVDFYDCGDYALTWCIGAFPDALKL